MSFINSIILNDNTKYILYFIVNVKMFFGLNFLLIVPIPSLMMLFIISSAHMANAFNLIKYITIVLSFVQNNRICDQYSYYIFCWLFRYFLVLSYSYIIIALFFLYIDYFIFRFNIIDCK
jgi:hypothetical protein